METEVIQINIINLIITVSVFLITIIGIFIRNENRISKLESNILKLQDLIDQNKKTLDIQQDDTYYKLNLKLDSLNDKNNIVHEGLNSKFDSLINTLNDRLDSINISHIKTNEDQTNKLYSLFDQLSKLTSNLAVIEERLSSIVKNYNK